jgi:catalase
MPMPQRSAAGSLVLIAVVVGVGAAAFAYTAGWFSPQRLTPGKLVAAFAPPGGPALGHRRNHAKGICFTGVFATGPGRLPPKRPPAASVSRRRKSRVVALHISRPSSARLH